MAAAVVLLSSAAPAASVPALQPAALPRNLVLADLGLHVVGVGYQRSLSGALAVQAAIESYTPWTQNIDLGGLSGAAYKSDLAGALLRVRAFYYPGDAAPTGLWISPFAQGGPAWATRDGARRTGTAWAVGASAGYALLVGPGVHLALGLGGQYHSASIPGGEGIPSFGRLYPTLDGSAGYAF